MTKNELDTFYPKSQKDWRKWLEENHETKQSIWLIYYKSATNIPSISWSQAVDQALCFGWIDSTKKAIDDTSYMQYFTKRKPNSAWSRVNKEKVTQLIQDNQMMKAGFEAIKTAKENGSWTFLDEIEALKIPEDLEQELIRCEGAMKFFNQLSNSNKKMLLHWVISAKRKETRQKRISEIAKNASKNLKPKPFR